MRATGTITLDFPPERIRYATFDNEQGIVLAKSVAFAGETGNIALEHERENLWRVLVNGEMKAPVIHMMLIDDKGNIELQDIDTRLLSAALPLAEPNPPAASGRGEIEIDPEDLVGTVFFGDTALLLEEDTSTANREFLQEAPLIRIGGFLVREKDGKWLISFDWETEKGNFQIPVTVKNTKNLVKEYLLHLPECRLENTSETRPMPEMRATASSGYFSLDMKKGFMEIGNTVIKLDADAGIPVILKDGEMQSRDFILRNIRGKMDGKSSWTLSYDFSPGSGKETSIPVRFIDETGGIFADIMADDGGKPVLVPKAEPDRPYVYNNFNMFNGDDEVFFSVQGQNGTPVGDGARFRLPEGNMSLYHMGKGWYVCEFSPNNEWKGRGIIRSVTIHGMESGGDEAEHVVNIRIQEQRP